MKTIIIVLGVIISLGVMYLLSKSNSGDKRTVQFAEKIQLYELKTVMEKLDEKKLEYDFFGITSNGTDCIYFVNEDNVINIEFEVMIEEQKKYVNRLKRYAKDKNFNVSQITYGNKPNYAGPSSAPVYRIETNSSVNDATEIGIDIMKSIFNKNQHSTFEVVP